MEVLPILLKDLAVDEATTPKSSKLANLLTKKDGVAKDQTGKIKKFQLPTAKSHSIASKSIANAKTQKEQITEAAQEFESIFVTQLISKMRESTGKTDFLGENSTAMKIFNGMLDEQYALQMSQSGQIGLADLIVEQLTKLIQLSPDSETIDATAQIRVELDGEIFAVPIADLFAQIRTELPEQNQEAIFAFFTEKLSEITKSETGEIPNLNELVATVIDELQTIETDQSEIKVAELISDPKMPITPIDVNSSEIAPTQIVEATTPQISAETIATPQISTETIATPQISTETIATPQTQTELIVPEQVKIGQTAQNLDEIEIELRPRQNGSNRSIEIVRDLSAKSEANLVEQISTRLIGPQISDTISKAVMMESLQNSEMPNTPVTQEIQSQLIQQVQSQTQQQRNALNQMRQQITPEIIGNETITNTQNVVVNWSQIQDLDTNNLANLIRSAEGLDPSSTSQMLTPDRVMIQIIDKISPQLARGMQTAIIELEPPSLGRVHIQLLFEDSVLSARIQVRNGMVSEVVRSNLGHLRDALADQGIQIDNFQVSTGDGRNGSFAQQNHFTGWEQNAGYRQRNWNGSQNDRSQRVIVERVNSSRSDSETTNILDPNSFNHLV